MTQEYTDCMYCVGGRVELWIGTDSETIDCPECQGTGLISPALRVAQEQELEAARQAREIAYA